jgi:cell division protein FtsB
MFEDLDLNAIHEENARELIKRLLNLIEQLSADLRDARAENQRLRDENNRLKGEQGSAPVKLARW